ncbi:MAG TPA: TonB-dependent receptor [Caulobacteraceae bacterium]|jgi:outer membrane receptor protein involved in Fe transport|nr:TonB-dependent receptor [Caulobacteraceae bacterium]
MMFEKFARKGLQSSVAAAALVILASPVAAIAQAQTLHFNIPAQNLGAALRTYGQVSGQPIIFSEDDVRGKRAPAVVGSFTANEALRQLLSGSGLEVKRTAGGVVYLGAMADAAPREAATRVQELVVTVDKRIQPLSTVGGGISAISGTKLEQMNANNLEDYLGFVPGVEFTSYGRPGQDQISIRGVASQALGSATATYVDDIPVGSASNEAQGASYTVDIDPADLERVEVLKGPQGTLYGASSLGGLLMYVTKAPSLTAASGDFGVDVNDVAHGGVGYKFRVAGTTPIIQDELGLRASAFYREDAGFIDNVLTGDKDINRDKAWGVRGSALYQPTQALQVRLGAVYQRTDADGLDAVSYNAVPDFPPPFHTSYGDLKTSLHLEQPNRSIDEVYSAEIRYDLGWANLVSATGRSNEDDYRYTDVTATYTRSSYKTLLHEAPDSTVSDVNNYDVGKTSEELRLESKDAGRLRWVGGLFYQDESSVTNALITVMGPGGTVAPQPYGQPAIGNAHNDLKELAEFVDATYYITPALDVSAGWRHSRIEQHNENDDTGLIYSLTGAPAVRIDDLTNDVNTYSAGARWRVTDDVMLYVRAASGFRPGGGRAQPPVVVSNFVTTYDPDTVWSYEAGVKAKAWDDRVTLDLDAFHIDWKNLQTLVAVGGGPYLVPGNGGNAISQGIEAQVQAVPVHGLSLTAGYAYTDAHYTSPNPGLGLNVGDQIEYVPATTASFQVEYERPLNDAWKGFIGGDWRYRSSELDAIGFRMPAFDQIGLHAGVVHGPTRINLYVTNLTDSRGLLGYTGGGNAAGDAFRYAVNPPRTIGLSITQRW